MATGKVVLLFGRTGAGKSSLGNTILGRAGYFTIGDALGSVTNLNSLKEGTSDNGRVLVFDTIGIGDTGLPPGRVADSIAETVRKTRDGIDVMIFVMQYGRITEDEKNMFMFIVNHLFGPEVLNNMYLVFTRSPEHLVLGDVAHRTAFLQAQASGAAPHFVEIWNQMGRNVQRIVFVDNPDPASTQMEALRPIYAQQVAHTQRVLLDIIYAFLGTRYQNSAMEAARTAYGKYLADAEAERQAALQAQAEQIAKLQIDANNAANMEERHRFEMEILKMKNEHELAIQKAQHDAALAAEQRLRENMERQAQSSSGGGSGGGWGHAIGDALLGPVGKLIGGVATHLVDKVVGSVAGKDCAIM